MNFPDKSGLFDKIDHADFCGDTAANEAIRSVFRKTVAKLCEYSGNQLKLIQNNVLYAGEKGRVGEIVFALADSEADTDWECLGLFPVAEDLQESVFFVDADYDVFRKMLGDEDTEKTYEGKYPDGSNQKSFKYCLRFNNTLLKRSDLIRRLEPIFGTHNAALFSPFLRKSVSIRITDALPQKTKEQIYREPESFRFAENALPLLGGKRLLWNLKVSAEEKKADEKRPCGTEEKYVFHFESDRSGLKKYAVPENNQTLIYDSRVTEDGCDLVIDRDYETFAVAEYYPINWDSSEIIKLRKDGKIFTNRFNKTGLVQKRILSEADIEFAVQPFRSAAGISCRTVSDLETVCPRYASKYRSRLESQERLFSKLKTVRLSFAAREHPKFFVDYINYVLMYLDYYYPEIEWVGGW